MSGAVTSWLTTGDLARSQLTLFGPCNCSYYFGLDIFISKSSCFLTAVCSIGVMSCNIRKKLRTNVYKRIYTTICWLFVGQVCKCRFSSIGAEGFEIFETISVHAVAESDHMLMI